MDKLEIRSLTQDDKFAALDIVIQERVGPKTRTLRFFNKSLRQKLHNIFVASIGDEIIGLSGWYQDKGDWAGKALGSLFPYGSDIYWVSYFAVKKEFRDKGIGTKLLNRLLKEVEQRKARELWVYTSRARGFYEKCGFMFVIKAVIERKSHEFMKKMF